MRRREREDYEKEKPNLTRGISLEPFKMVPTTKFAQTTETVNRRAYVRCLVLEFVNTISETNGTDNLIFLGGHAGAGEQI